MPQPPESVRDAVEHSEVGRLRRARHGRRIVLALAFCLVVLGAASVLGVREGVVSASAEGVELTLTYGAVTRLGLGTPWELQITKDGGFDGPVTVATTKSYFEIFDQNDLSPQPSSSTSDRELIIWEFDPPEGDSLTIDLDARIAPMFLGGRSANTTVREEGMDVVGVQYRTRVMP